MSDHSFIPKANPKIVPPAIPAPRKESLEQDNARLKAEVERLKEGNECLDQMHEKEMARSAFLCEQVERLTKAVMHSPSAQLKLKELEGKTTYEEINPDNQ
jgi:hypothetical protein